MLELSNAAHVLDQVAGDDRVAQLIELALDVVDEPDSKGEKQPMQASWNRLGYNNNGVEEHGVTVQVA